MSAATSAERSAGRRIADSVLDAVAAPLSFIDQSTSYSHHLEKRLLAEGKRRLLECLDRELATDLHEHYRSAHRTLISGFSQMESAYCRWRDDYIRQTLARLDRERQASGTPIPPDRRRAYRFRARRFVKRHQVLLDLDRRRHSAANPMSVYEEIISEAPMCLAAFEALQSEVRRMVTPDLVDHYRRRFGVRCLTLWQHAVEHVYGHTSPRPGPVELGADYGEDAPEEGNLRGLKGWLTRRAADDATRPLFDRHMERYLRGLVCNYESGSARARTDPGVDASMPPSGPRPDSAETTFRLLFPGRPWRRPTAGDNVRPPVELAQLQLIREIATGTFRDFDECDQMSPWSLGRLQWIDRPMLRRIFTEIVERSPEPIPLTDVLEIVKRNRPPGRGFTDDEEPYITYHLQTVVAGFSQVIAAYHRAYRETLANQSDSDRTDDGRNGARNFGWSRLWPTIWSRESTALWTDREPFDGGVPLPVTYRLVFNQGHDGDAVESVMLVPLFPVKRTLASRPLREFFEYMHSGMVAVLPGDNQVARHPYRVAAALGQSVRLLRGIGRVLGFGGRLLWYRYGPRNSAGDTSARRLALWNSSARGFIRLGSQRHGTLDQIRASLLTALPRVLPDLPGARVPREGRHQDWSPRGRREAKLRLMLTPVPHLMWCDTVYALGQGWRNDEI